ncbi:hypothetical protein LCGC14_1459500 [marine sediment metagenome]|uniref:Uncharacterized protein n=1 Tax=marine sediment metagenome TaxID=412755 RepID=A0A0F9LW42_9ZZZZ
MGLVDGLTALAVIVGFFYIIAAQVLKKNPQAFDKIQQYFSSKQKPPEDLRDKMQQIYPEKRMGL